MKVKTKIFNFKKIRIFFRIFLLFHFLILQKKNRVNNRKKILAISQFAHHPQPMPYHAHGGIQNVVTRVYWLERINMDVKCIVKFELIQRCVLLLIAVPVMLLMIVR